MTNRKLAILGLVAIAMVVLAVVQSHVANRPAGQASEAAYLIQGLDPDQIAGIIIGTGVDQAILNRQSTGHLTAGRGFVVASKDNYPALAEEINKLITECLDVKTEGLYTKDPGNFEDLGVTEPDARYVVKFFKADSSLLTGIIVGKLREQGRGTYVRRVDDDNVYISFTTPWIKKRALDYVDQELINVDLADIESVTVTSPNEVYTLTSDDEGKTVKLMNMPEGKKLKDNIANRVWTALGNLRFDDVKRFSPDSANIGFERTYACRLKNSMVYTIKLAQENNKWFARCDAEFTDTTPVTKTQGEVESQEQLKKKEATLLARDSTEDFAEKHSRWLYELPDYRVENLTMELSGLLEDVPEQQEPQTGDQPTEAAAGQMVDEMLDQLEPNEPNAP